MNALAPAKRAVRSLLPYPIYRAVRQRRVHRLIERFPSRAHHGTYGGHALTIRFEDPLAAAWYGNDWPPLPEIGLLRESGRLRAGARVFDLGAHQAVVALMFSREVGDDGHVVAVEADPHNARVAEANVRGNDARNTTVVHAAVAAEAGTLHFASGLNGSIDDRTASGNVAVRAVTIDSLADEHGPPDIVFIDIEGYEGRALRAAPKTLSSPAAFFVEVHVGQLVDATAEEIVELFAGRSRFIARDPGGDGAEHVFVPYDGRVPDRRFYLLAV